MSEERTVLIVDESEEIREVLSTALQKRGVKTLCTALKRRGLELAKEHHPDLMIIDLELEKIDPRIALEQFVQEANSNDSQILILGSVRLESDEETEFIQKPCHFGPLLRKIDQLIRENESRHM